MVVCWMRRCCESGHRGESGFPVYTVLTSYILSGMTKHLVDIDEGVLSAARAELGTSTLKETVNEALRRTAATRDGRVKRGLDRLAAANLGDREDAWR